MPIVDGTGQYFVGHGPNLYDLQDNAILWVMVTPCHQVGHSCSISRLYSKKNATILWILLYNKGIAHPFGIILSNFYICIL